jgi:hypothetical protein
MKMLKLLPLYVVLGLVGVVSFAATAHAAATVASATDSQSLLDLLRPVFDAFLGKHYAFGASLLVVAAVALLKRASASVLGDKLVAFLHGDAGGALLALLASGAGSLAVTLATPTATLSLTMLKTALVVGFGAAGGYAMIKALIVEPLLKPLAAKAPSWLQLPLNLLLWFFDKGDAGAAALANAKAAGDAAVAAKPGAGLDAVTGTPTDVK